MNCGSSDVLCHVLDLLGSFGADASFLTGVLARVGDSLRENVQPIVGLAGLSFGVWKWWQYRESVLHRRLLDYLTTQDGRLVRARSYVVEALHRPGAERNFAEPLFATRPLRRLLKRRGW